MAMNSRLIQRARELQRTGHYADARAVLDTVLASDPDNLAGWQLRLEVSESPVDRETALRALLLLQPDNEEWWDQLVSLNASRALAQQRPHRFRPLYWAAAALVLMVAAVALFFVTHNPLQADVDRLTNYNHNLTASYNQLEQLYRGLATKYDALQATHAKLHQDFDQLQGQYATLRQQHADLAAQHQTLQQQYTKLTIDYKALETDLANLNAYSDQLSASYAEFRNIAIAPPYIFIQGRMITLTFKLNDDTIRYWRVDFQGLENDIERGWAKREQLHHDQLQPIILQSTSGVKTTAPDFREFVDPAPFRDVMLSLYYDVKGDEEAFLNEAWHITRQLTRYVSDAMDVETPRYPFETLLAGGGDCEDTSILLASLLKAAPFDWHVYLVYMDFEHPTSSQHFDHVLVMVNNGTRNYYIETTSEDIMEYWGPWIDGRSYEVP